MTNIIESDMTFVVRDEKCLYHIEKSDIYKQLKNKGIGTTEFIYFKSGNTLEFVEAKKTCPNVNNKEESNEKRIKYEEYYQNLINKFTDSMSIMSALFLDKLEEDGMGSQISGIKSLRDIKICLILVIKNAEELWLGGVKAELERRLLKLRGIWKLEIKVLNEELAVKKGLVRQPS